MSMIHQSTQRRKSLSPQGQTEDGPLERTSSDSDLRPRTRFRDRIKAAWHGHSEAKEKNQYERVHNIHHKVLRLHHVLKGKRVLCHREHKCAPVGNVAVSILGGSFYTPRPYFILELDGNEERTPTALTSAPDWEDNPETQFNLPIYDASSDLRIFLFDENSHHHERCRGRVIIPLRSLCTKGFFCMPKPASVSRFKVMPPGGQHDQDLQARFREAVPGVPGTGMVKPDPDIGILKLRLQLELTAPGASHFGLLAAYAQVPAGGLGNGDEDQNDSSSDEDPNRNRLGSQMSMKSAENETRIDHKDSRPSSKIIKAYSMRLKRCMHTAYILKRPWCFSLPMLWYLVCFHMAAFMMPWILMGLFLTNGILASFHPEDRTQDIIFWEDSVGPSTRPRGLQKIRRIYGHVRLGQQALIKVTTFLERRQHAFDFSDPAVTIVAFGFLLVVCIISSLILYIFDLRVVIFILGLAALVPFLRKACTFGTMNRGTLPDEEANSDQGQAGKGRYMRRADSSLEQDEIDEKRHRRMRCRHAKHQFHVGIKMLRNVLSRVPDGGDIAHEYFCTVEQRLP